MRTCRASEVQALREPLAADLGVKSVGEIATVPRARVDKRVQVVCEAPWRIVGLRGPGQEIQVP